MKAAISARGYTSVILAMNMKRFVSADERDDFETLRGKREFGHVLRTDWPQALRKQSVFMSVEEYKRRRIEQEGKQLEPGDTMSTDQIGFATGIFRSLMLEEYSFPAYALDKSCVEFLPDLESNYQFKNLFKKVWDRWDIYIRPTFSGFFVIRLTFHYQDKARSLLSIAQDVLRLQDSIDVPSAKRWLELSRERYAGDPKTLSDKVRSVQALLDWMGSGEQDADGILYYPIQWKIAMEVASRFVQWIAPEISIPEGKTIHLTPPDPSLTIPLHDSYVIHHFDQLLAEPSAIKPLNGKPRSKNQVAVKLNDIRQSHMLKRALVNLVEGSLLRNQTTTAKSTSEVLDTQTIERTSYFPNPEWNIVDCLFEQNQASWHDEFCLLGPRTALIMPSQEWKNSQISVSTVPSSTLHVKYARYWGAIERMIEFLVEIRVLSQLIESEAYDLLGEIAQTVHETRFNLFSGDIKLDNKRLPDLVSRAAQLRRLAALSQNLSHPQLWSRAEYAIKKATYLLDQLGVPIIQEHIQSSIASISSLVDHVDELYLADLSEKSNDASTVLSLVLAAASFTLTLLVLPSFWADIWGILPNAAMHPSRWQWILAGAGTFFGAILILCAVGLMISAWRQRKRMMAMFRKLYQDPAQQ